MGCLSNDEDCNDAEFPVHEVDDFVRLRLSKQEVTFATTGMPALNRWRLRRPSPEMTMGWGRGVTVR